MNENWRVEFQMNWIIFSAISLECTQIYLWYLHDAKKQEKEAKEEKTLTISSLTESNQGKEKFYHVLGVAVVVKMFYHFTSSNVNWRTNFMYWSQHKHFSM